jgi:spore coat protein H
MKYRFKKLSFLHKNKTSSQSISEFTEFKIEQKSKRKRVVFISSVLLVIFVGFLYYTNRSQQDLKLKDSDSLEVVDFDINQSLANGQPIEDVIGLYQEYNQTEVTYLYLTLYPGENGQGESWQFEDVNKYTTKVTPDPWVDVLVQQGDQNGILTTGFGSSQIIPQGRLRQRGASARLVALKSYKINFYDGIEPWRGQETLNLNKHYKDETRIKQKFVYDMVPLVGNMVGARTTFVHLMIKDTTSGSMEYEDYGLYTHVEQPNKDFLRAHGLDDNGHLYNATNLEYQISDNFLEEYDGSEVSISELETMVEVEVGNDDHSKLLEMLAAVNDYDLDFDDVLSQYFNEDNLYTWLAFNILINNVDSTSQNFMLYNASNSTTWYILPWDNDKTFYTDHFLDEDRDNVRHYGLARFWNMVVFQRLVSNPESLEKLNTKIEEINLVFQRQETENLLEAYASIAVNQLSTLPDLASLNGEITELYDKIVNLNDLVVLNKDRYYQGLESPMPFFLGDPTITDEDINLNWSYAEDLQGDTVKYLIEISNDNDFSNIILEKDVGINTNISIEKLIPGVYYFRVTAYDPDNNTQISFDRYLDENKSTIYGMKSFVVE